METEQNITLGKQLQALNQPAVVDKIEAETMMIEYISISEDDVYDEVIEFMYELKDLGLYNNQK